MDSEPTPELFLPEQPLPPGADVTDSKEGAHVPSASQARLLVFVAAVLWSTSGFFVKSPYLAGWSGPQVACWRAVFACLALWPLVRRPVWSWRFIPMTVLFAGMNYTYLTAMVKGSAANAIWLQCTAPVWVLLVGVFVFGERAIWRDWFMVACAAVGIGMILFFESQGVALDAVLWALASSFFYAGVVLSLRQLRGFNSVWLAALNHLVTAIALAPFAVAAGHFPSGMQWIFLAGLGVLQMGFPYTLFAYGLKRIPGHEATVICLIEPLMNPLWVFLAWGDRPQWWTVAGGACILVGLGVRYLWPARAPQNA